MGFVVDKVALQQAFSEDVRFPCQFFFHPLTLIIYHPELVQRSR
jgi:hypothetical protein